MEEMILSRGFWRDTICPARNAVRITPEIIECDCPECEGTGDWTRFYPDTEPGEYIMCVECKGTGRINA